MKKRFSLPYVISLRGGDVPGFFVQKLRFYHLLTKPVIKSVWKEAEHVIANSYRLYELAKQTEPYKTISVIPNGVDTDKYKPICGKHTEISKIRILTVGRLSVQKGLSNLLKACYILNQNGLQGKFTLDILGDGPSRRMLEKLSRNLHLQNAVCFTGWISRKQISIRYNTADIFVLTSLDEGMSNALLEAMASGLPVVASNLAGDNFLINEENALIVPVNNKESLSNALKQLITDDDLRKKMELNSRATAKRFSWAENARAYDSICQTQ
ncbi:glycosyl transferase family protein [Candidatus Scalindua japonica]|uniref:Glycosyl transferase family protein n=2 Tax=Candidatus Scalindua japonica TaxID=1284222 RepID=A0A286TWY0_9BACT|nr:glycosyl transferase family protein [Candidatus Scalindua japonica]